MWGQHLLRDKKRAAFRRGRASMCSGQSSQGRAWHRERACPGPVSSLWPDCRHEQRGHTDTCFLPGSLKLCACMTSSENSGCWDSDGFPGQTRCWRSLPFPSWRRRGLCLSPMGHREHGGTCKWVSLWHSCVPSYITTIHLSCHCHGMPSPAVLLAEACTWGEGSWRSPKTVWDRICLGEAPPYASD